MTRQESSVRRIRTENATSFRDALGSIAIGAEVSYAILAAAQWGFAAGWIYGTHEDLWCGNVISDPYLFLMNVVTPMAAVFGVCLVWERMRTRRWSLLAGFCLSLFVVTTAALIYESWWLEDYFGFSLLRCVWWIGIGRWS
jgi:hypothetical protein